MSSGCQTDREITDFDHQRDMPFLGPLLEKEWPKLYAAQFPGLNHSLVASRFQHQKISNHTVYIKVARVKEQTAGFITYYRQSQNRGHIDLLAVSEEFRKQGIAFRLLSNAENHFKQEPKISSLDILVHNTNSNAQNLYEKLGYILQQSTNNSVWRQLIKKINW